MDPSNKDHIAIASLGAGHQAQADKSMGTGHQAQADKSMGIGYDEVIRVEGSKGMTQHDRSV